MSNKSVSPSEPFSLLEIAKNVSMTERPHALKTLAQAVCTHDPITIETIADQVKAYGLLNKTAFLKAVREEKTKIQAQQGLTVKPTDDELAERWLAKYPDTAFGLGDFRRYENGIWPQVDKDQAMKEILAELELAKAVGIKPTSQLLDSVNKIARVKASIPNDKWDNQVDYLPCLNGVLALSNRALLPHSQDWYFTTKLNYDYDLNADCPNFKLVVNKAIPEAANFLQEFAGYALTIDTSLEIALWLYGPPGSGRSSIVTGLQAMLGSRAGILSMTVIERSQFGLTNMVGKTLLMATESPDGLFAATDILNAIISGETIEVDRKFRDPIQTEPYAKVVWAMNALPRIKDPGNGLFRRIQVIRFPPLEKNKRDPMVKEAIKTEGAGILNWALDGLDRLRQRGHFEIPECVQAATEDFKLRNDVPRMFVNEKCTVGKGIKVQSSKLYAAYETWCWRNGHKPQSTTTLAEDWQRLGFTRSKSNGLVFWKGIDLRA